MRRLIWPRLGIDGRQGQNGLRATFTPAAVPGLSAWYDPSDLSTLFQDTAMTVPVTAAGQSVAAIKDKSGNSHHATQGAAAKRPTYQTGLTSFDGVDDALVVPTFEWGSDEMTMIVGVRKLNDTMGIIAEFGANYTAYGSWYFIKYTTPQTEFSGRGARAGVVGDIASVPIAAPETGVYTMSQKINGGTPSRMRRNAGAWAYSVRTDFGGGDFHSWPLYIGARQGSILYSAVYIYGIAIYNRLLTDAEIRQGEQWMAAKAGVEL